MRIAYASDLHLEFDSSLTLTGLSGVDVLVLAGDVDTMPEYYTEILRKLRLAYAGPVLFVLGNHEYYNGVFPDDRQKYREAIAHDRQAVLLENEAVILDGVRFLDATLWTDFASGRQMRSCQRMMADFDVIFDDHSESITPELILKAHQDTMDCLGTRIVRYPHEGPRQGSAQIAKVKHPINSTERGGSGGCDLRDEMNGTTGPASPSDAPSFPYYPIIINLLIIYQAHQTGYF